MKRKITRIIVGTVLILGAEAHAEVFDGIGKPVGKSSSESSDQSSAPMPPNHPPMGNMGNTGMNNGSMSEAGMMQPDGPVMQGKVLEVTNGAGYSYLLLESGGAKFWIAGTQVEAKQGDVVSFIENVTMENFTSKTLNKTFDRIVFASSVKVVP